jgi:hypothetical protein
MTWTAERAPRLPLADPGHEGRITPEAPHVITRLVAAGDSEEMRRLSDPRFPAQELDLFLADGSRPITVMADTAVSQAGHDWLMFKNPGAHAHLIVARDGHGGGAWRVGALDDVELN